MTAIASAAAPTVPPVIARLAAIARIVRALPELFELVIAHDNRINQLGDHVEDLDARVGELYVNVDEVLQ